MTISHRIFSSHFLHPSHVHCSAKVVGVRSEEASSGITSTPWEGLYLEVNEDVDVDNDVADGLHPNLDLERFLDSLMFGE